MKLFTLCSFVHSRLGVTVIALALVLSACSTPLVPTTVTPTLTPPALYPTRTPIVNQDQLIDAMKERWLEGDPCAPPCFENITPGHTTVSETLEALRKNPLVFDAQVDTGAVTWYWAGQGAVNAALFDTNDPNKVIRNILVVFPRSLLFGEVLEAYGEPSHLIVHNSIKPNGQHLNILAIYVPQGFALEARIGPLESIDKPLDKELVFDTGYFFKPNEDEIAGAVSSSWTNEDIRRFLVPWQGFQDYSYYCREFYEGDTSCSYSPSP
jgi:hypothetical protein